MLTALHPTLADHPRRRHHRVAWDGSPQAPPARHCVSLLVGHSAARGSPYGLPPQAARRGGHFWTPIGGQIWTPIDICVLFVVCD